ncbi:battenin CLN3 protein [Tulasnella sp. 331]|nr:battenin CLN3 protein [Tulasnella sp. 331]
MAHPEDDELSAPLLDAGSDASTSDNERKLRLKLGISFFIFGLINNILYVVILSAALDLVPPSTPKGLIAFCNIFPALVAKIGVLGMTVVAGFDSLGMRLLGICLASFSSDSHMWFHSPPGLGELTFLQLSTTYPIALAGHSVGYFASGTGGAGVGGAGFWWEVRSLGVKKGVALSGVLPFVIPLTYFFLLPAPSKFAGARSSSAAYAAIPTADPTVEEDEGEETDVGSEQLADTDSGATATAKERPLVIMLTFADKIKLLEYTINQGIAPTLIYPVPDASQHWLIGHIIHSLRDYYPLWQLVYQTFVFFSRSSISIGVPSLPTRLLWAPAIVQAGVLLTLVLESAIGIFPEESNPTLTFLLVFTLIAVEGVCGGLAYVNVFYRVGQENHPSEGDDAYELEKKKQEREFKIGSIGFADSLGILLASLIAMPTEIGLCKAQVGRGKTFCKTL